MIEYRTIQYINAKFRGIYDKLKYLNENKTKNLYFTGVLSTPPINIDGVFMLMPNGQMYQLQEPGYEKDFMTPITHPMAIAAAVAEARKAVKGKHSYILPTLNLIERTYNMDVTVLQLDNSRPIGSEPLF